MNVLLFWSKERSKALASALHEWLPKVAPGIEPWMSSKDMDKGVDWLHELQDVLKKNQNCIICFTPENVRSPWIYYETGAVATNGLDVSIYPYLLGVAPSMLADGPIGQGRWQCTEANRDDTWTLIKSLNKNVLKSKHSLALLEANFQSRWSEFEERLAAISQIETVDEEDFIATDADQLAGINLSSEARIMVLEVSKSKDGMLGYIRVSGGPYIQVDGKDLCPDQSPRTVAKWKSALDDLVAYNILEPRGHRGEVFALAAKGYEIADALGEA